MNKLNWKAIFKVCVWVICLAAIGLFMSFISIQQKTIKCENIDIFIPGSDNFIEREEIDYILKLKQGQLIGRNLELINTQEIEADLLQNPYIAFAKVFVDMNGSLKIEIKQRQPVLRIINAGGQDFYVDKTGLKMPISMNFTADVMVATGNILEGFGGRLDTLRTSLVKDLYQTALFLKKDSLWDAQIEQLYVNEASEIELIPRVGNQRIIIGDAKSLPIKMDNLLAFYKQAMPEVGWEVYKTINVKYTNQIICEKNLNNLKENKDIKSPVEIDTSQILNQVIKAEIEKVIKAETRAGSKNKN
ncbi:MAG: cell division protein FtsQ [Pedobacter sp.]|nr:MAG: cell division protein FtsQ [Pedobacter sp.]